MVEGEEVLLCISFKKSVVSEPQVVQRGLSARLMINQVFEIYM